MAYLLMASPLLFPVICFAVTRWLAPGLWWLQLAAAALAGGAGLAFIGAAASAMATAVSTSDAMTRGFLVGLVPGIVVGLVCLGICAAWSRLTGQRKAA